MRSGLTPLIDADILRYEIGFGAEKGWTCETEGRETVPPFSYVFNMLEQRINNICDVCETDKIPELYITEGKSFRHDIAKRKPYKGTRVAKKPWHFDNLTAYFRSLHNCLCVSGIEADDAMAINHCDRRRDTVLCSRDKDLRQLPGAFYSWELGKQPAFGPIEIDKLGSLKLDKRNGTLKLTGTGLSWFYAQVLIGDVVDNIPGLPDCGPREAFNLLNGKSPDVQLDAVCKAYKEAYQDNWEAELTEQGQLCWMTRRLNTDGSPVLWQIGMVE